MDNVMAEAEDIALFGRVAVALLSRAVEENRITDEQIRALYAFMLDNEIVSLAGEDEEDDEGEAVERGDAAPESQGDDDGEDSPPDLSSSPAPVPGSKTAPIVVETSDDVDEAGKQVKRPTEAQAAAGNYRKGHVRIAGLDIAIETPKDGIRMGRDASGKRWKVRMPVAYGYIKRAGGADGDNLDVYVGPTPENDDVFLIDQIDIATGEFDEVKVIMGASSEKQARNIYRRGFSDGRGADRIGGMTRMTMEEFKTWLREGGGTEALVA